MTKWLKLALMSMTFVGGLSFGGSEAFASACSDLAKCLAPGGLCRYWWTKKEIEENERWMDFNC